MGQRVQGVQPAVNEDRKDLERLKGVLEGSTDGRPRAGMNPDPTTV
jgi:hypothetical protein